jgi:4-oxalomesaconate tautomerase
VELADLPSEYRKAQKIEHPIGQEIIVTDLDAAENVNNASILRTARKLFDGVVFAS